MSDVMWRARFNKHTNDNPEKPAEFRHGLILQNLAGTTGLEPATSDVTGRRSNQLNYVPFMRIRRTLEGYHAGGSGPPTKS
jgi:hypothetical protein